IKRATSSVKRRCLSPRLISLECYKNDRNEYCDCKNDEGIGRGCKASEKAVTLGFELGEIVFEAHVDSFHLANRSQVESFASRSFCSVAIKQFITRLAVTFSFWIAVISLSVKTNAEVPSFESALCSYKT